MVENMKKIISPLLFLVSYCLPFYKVVDVIDGETTESMIYGFQFMLRNWSIYLLCLFLLMIFLWLKQGWILIVAVFMYVLCLLSLTTYDFYQFPIIYLPGYFIESVFPHMMYGIYIHIFCLALLGFFYYTQKK